MILASVNVETRSPYFLKQFPNEQPIETSHLAHLTRTHANACSSIWNAIGWRLRKTRLI